MKGYDPDRIAQSEADHFVKCPGCGEWFDMRDLAQVLGTSMTRRLEINEAPPPRNRSVQ
jgi:hypothetical protein